MKVAASDAERKVERKTVGENGSMKADRGASPGSGAAEVPCVPAKAQPVREAGAKLSQKGPRDAAGSQE